MPPEPVRVVLPRDAGRLAVLGTAYLLSERAHASVSTERGCPVLTLTPRPGADAAGLREEALRVFEGQALRWALAVSGAPLAAELSRRAVAASSRPSGAGASLSDADKTRIAALLAEPKLELADPAGIRTPFSALKRPG
ncbi:MAG: hypothetical protein HY928_18165 [Elusimicrobia bacterium]|nr:hypothetical protein [Elusimicrobiota bacterium]